MPLAGRNRSLVANTSRCGEDIRDTSEDKWELGNEIFREQRVPRQQGKSRFEEEESPVRPSVHQFVRSFVRPSVQWTREGGGEGAGLGWVRGKRERPSCMVCAALPCPGFSLPFRPCLACSIQSVVGLRGGSLGGTCLSGLALLLLLLPLALPLPAQHS